MRFSDKVAIVTGAANGIGRATAKILASEGATVVGVDTDPARLASLHAETTGAPGRVSGQVCDVLDEEQVGSLVAQAATDFGRIDILVNVVGGSTIVPNPAAHIDMMTHDEWRKILDFNLEGTFLFCHTVAPLMKAQGSGKIINLSSIAGRAKAPRSSAAYAAAKGAIIIFTAKLAEELGPHGINVNAIAPGVTLTERVRPFWDGRTDEQRAFELRGTPLRRMSEPEDQAKVICFLASSDADFVSGVTIDVTGGF